MSRVVMGRSKIEGRICPRTRVEDRGRYLGIPRTERFRILECPGNRVRYTYHFPRSTQFSVREI
jgi:hypothetical protein